MPKKNSMQNAEKRCNSVDLDTRLYSPMEEITRTTNYMRRRNTNAELIHTDDAACGFSRCGR